MLRREFNSKGAHHVHDLLIIKTNEKSPDFLIFHLSETVPHVFFHDANLVIENNLKSITFLIDTHRDHVHDLPPHLGDFFKFLETNFLENHDHYSEKFPMLKKKLEVNMYTTQMTTAITPTIWFHKHYLLSQSKSDSNLPSRLEIVFQSESGASIPVLIIPTYMMIIQRLNVCNHDQQDTLTIAYHSEVQ